MGLCKKIRAYLNVLCEILLKYAYHILLDSHWQSRAVEEKM